MRLFFASEGCKLVTLETAEEAIKTVKSRNFDIIIADFRLPGMDGIELFKRIPDSGGKPIKILITAYMSSNVIEDARKAMIHELIEKPFKPETIQAVLSKLINQVHRKEVDHVSEKLDEQTGRFRG